LYEIMSNGALEANLKNSRFLLLMNGMGNRERFNLSSNAVFEGITSIGVNFSTEGSVELRGRGKTSIEAGIDGEIERFMRSRFDEKGFKIEFSSDFKRRQWDKLLINAVINPITALSRRQNGVVLSPGLQGMVERLVEECAAVSAKEGYGADRGTILNLINNVASNTSENTSSMLQDVLKGKGTEIDSINGYLIWLAKKHGIQTPINEALYGLVKSVEGNG
jgi:2-dehydropantoate 2-reductase